MKKYELVKSDHFIKQAGSGILSASDLVKVFINTSKLLIKEADKAGFLICPDEIREYEARNVMCRVLTEQGINHMLERPIYNPMKKNKKQRASWIDLSIYLESGIVDIEFKKSPNSFITDFEKLLTSSAIGCNSFYIFNNKKFDLRKDFIIGRYQDHYEEVYEEVSTAGLIKDKWFQLFLLSFYEQRIFMCTFDTINEMNFKRLKEYEANLLH